MPKGRISEVFGAESAGKSTLGQHLIAQTQASGGMAAYIDAEHAMDPSYAAKCGINIEELLISQPDTGEQALEIAEALIRSNAVDIIVVDSVAALVPRAEIEGEMGQGAGLGVERARRIDNMGPPPPLDPSTRLPPRRILHRRTFRLRHGERPLPGLDSRLRRTCSPTGVGNDGVDRAVPPPW